ncbi:hypothetical protein GCM10027347_44580 [Larkinella harenae]
MQIKSVIVKYLTVNGKRIKRYFFEWHERRNLGMQVLRLKLFDSDSNPIGKEQSVKLEKVKQVGTVTVDGKERPHYDRPIWFALDMDFELPDATSFEYRTVNVLKKSDPLTGIISTDREDLRAL